MLYQNLQIRPEDLPRLEDLEFNRHPSSYWKLRMISKCIIFLILLSPVIIIHLANVPNALLIGFSVWFALLIWSLFVEFKSFPLRGYLVREQDISYRKGWIFRSITSIPYNRIQHSEVSQGPIERQMKLSSLKIFTAGGSSSDLSIKGLKPEEAERLREWLTDKTSQHV